MAFSARRLPSRDGLRHSAAPFVTFVASGMNASELSAGLTPRLAIDITLADLRSRTPLDMGTPFDTFSRKAHTANATGELLARRLRLTRVMGSQGFVNYAQEWWHFSYAVANGVPLDRVIR